MFKQHLAGASGYDAYLILSLFIFLLFFIGVAIRLWFFDKKEIDYLKNIPFEKADANES